jgi:hypothetical protein
VVSLAGGAGSRWTQGAGVVKALNPFCKLGGAPQLHRGPPGQEPPHRPAAGAPLPARFHHQLPDPRADRARWPRRATTATRAAAPVARAAASACAGADGARPALRLGGDAAATARRAGAEGAREPARRADRLGPAAGEGSDYTDNLPLQCLHPVGHWYEVPNLLRNGVLRAAARAAAAALPDGAQHRHPGRGRRPGAARAGTSSRARR